ncbi:CRISPR-associated CARF protein Csa3 [Thermococcus sp. SY098]|uniref:CRISPR-associated CARF protein Csa3 n=1 Tax=Thermococcus sp. SY098 TaxID=3111325 RepID=UPI002D785779|nr:CRISPR-associated CARF protein Csa3 [Thermococcus sp. SY098]WRS52694.1 CRISPR-associated CARF protein Csa3 [Thermococcus sp. SY098]
MLVVFPLGFDEKFIVRALIRNKLKKEDKLLAILPEGYEKEERTITALKNLQGLLKSLTSEDSITVVEVPLGSGEDMVLTIRKEVLRHLTPDREILAVLSGGMRALTVTTLAALSSLQDVSVRVESDFENLAGFISFDLTPILAPADIRWVRILCGIYRGKSIRKTAEEIGTSPATVSRELQRMMHYNLVRPVRAITQVVRYEITDGGMFYLKLYGDDCIEV